MSGGILEPAELEAIQAAMEQTVEKLPATAPVRPIALIRAREEPGQSNQLISGLLQRFAYLVDKAFMRTCGLSPTFKPAGSAMVEPEDLRRRMAQVWLQAGSLESHLPILLGAGGPMVESVAAHLLGAEPEEEDEDEDEAQDDAPERHPSIAARAIFARVGQQISLELTRAMTLELDRRLDWEEDRSELSRQLLESEDILGLKIEVESPFRGTFEVYGAPDAFRPAMGRREEEFKPRLNASHLADVPVELSVVLGQARLTLRQLTNLTPGTLLELDRTAEDLLPVRCRGVEIAMARPMASDSTLSVCVEAGPQQLKGNQR